MPRALDLDRGELIYQLRGVGTKRHGPRSLERRLMHAAADLLERDAESPITVEAVEEALGGRTLLPWQRKVLEGGE